MKMDVEDMIHVRPNPLITHTHTHAHKKKRNNLRGCFTRGAKLEHEPLSLCWSISPLAVHYPFCCWINGAIDQRQTCVSKKAADQSPTAGPDTGVPISTATARVITNAWLGQASEALSLIPTFLGSLTVMGDGIAVGWEEEAENRFNKAKNLAGIKTQV